MSKELVIASNRHETKVAVLEDDQLVEVYFQRANEYSLAGSIHKGRVTRVLPGMQSAFVDLGLERDTFLYVSDFFEENEDFDPVSAEPAQRATPIVERAPDRNSGGDRGNDRGDRRGDRGRDRGPRYQDRSPEARSPESRQPEGRQGDARPVSVPSEAAGEPSLVAEPVTAPTESIETINPTLARIPPMETRSEGDRQDRDRNDDRRRRSRRRRTRGRGFPENKYAATGAASSEPEPTARYAAPAPEAPIREDVAVARSASDLLILPGESLAKYRQGGGPRVVEQVEKAADHEPVEPAELSLRPLDEDEKLEIVSKIEDRLDEIESSEEEHEVLLHGHGAVVHPEPASAAGIAPLILRPEVKAAPLVLPLDEAAESAEEIVAHASHADPHPLSLIRSDEASAAYEARIEAELHEAIRGDQVEPVEPDLAEEAEAELSDEERAEALAGDLISEDASVEEPDDEPEEGEPAAGVEAGGVRHRRPGCRRSSGIQASHPNRIGSGTGRPVHASYVPADAQAPWRKSLCSPGCALPPAPRPCKPSPQLRRWKCARNLRSVRKLVLSALNGQSVWNGLSAPNNEKSGRGLRRNVFTPPSPTC